MANSNCGIRRIAKLYKTFSIKYPDLLGIVKRDQDYYLERRLPLTHNSFGISFYNRKIWCHYFNLRGRWVNIIINPKAFYKVYQIVESWLRDE